MIPARWMVVAALAAAPLLAQAPREAVVADARGLVLPAGDFAVVELVDTVAAFLCRNYLHDAGALAALPGFTLHRPLALDARGAEELLYALVAARGGAVLPLDEPHGVYQIVLFDGRLPAAGVAAVPWRPADEVLRRPQLRELVTSWVELTAADAAALVPLLRAAFPRPGPWHPGQLQLAAPDRRVLLVSGYRDQVAAVLQLALRADRLAVVSGAAAPADVAARLQALEQEVAALRQLVRELRPAAGR